jgi:hypothetical protein
MFPEKKNTQHAHLKPHLCPRKLSYSILMLLPIPKHIVQFYLMQGKIFRVFQAKPKAKKFFICDKNKYNKFANNTELSNIKF